jgi:hypothetical protein
MITAFPKMLLTLFSTNRATCISFRISIHAHIFSCEIVLTAVEIEVAVPSPDMA